MVQQFDTKLAVTTVGDGGAVRRVTGLNITRV